MTDDLDAKIARLGARVKTRSEDGRAQLEAMGALEIAQLLRETFQAKCVYLGPESGYPHGQIYNHDLRPTNATVSPDYGYSESAPTRSSNLPYRGKANQGKRKSRRAPQPDRQRDPPKTWHDLQNDS